ncbi:hypothetical protein ACGFZP_16610 [Kitasatospora sp. NPDC048239]|uniref:hypothetical protein n=1 Tax=Kitasatospora sp. NPDC048239 TaxID=3364046 RepID=UPI003715CF0D
MRVKLRPGTHLASVRQGVYVSRAGRSFVLAGPPALYGVLDSRLAELTDGTDLEALVAAFGDEAARPVLDRVVRALLDHDVLLDLDALTTPPPDRATAARYAEVLAYLEAHSGDPYRDFARLRAARVRVLGEGPAAVTAVRSLARHGIGAVTDPVAGPDVPDDGAPGAPAWAVLIDDHDHPADLAVLASDLPPGTRAVTVRAGERIALVGEPAPGSPAALRAAARRAEAWAADDPEACAARPLSAVLAGALAARQVLAGLTGLAGLADPTGADPEPKLTGPGTDAAHGVATVVHGRLLRTSRIALAPGSAVPGAAVPAPEEPPAPEERPDAEALLAAWSGLTARWTGPLRRGRDLDLDQLPFALETVEAVDADGASPVERRAAGWGVDRPAAGLSAVLAGTRLLAARAASATGVPAAGSTPDRWLLDGLLRVLGAEALAAPPARELGWDDLADLEARTLLGLLETYFGRSVTLTERRPDGPGWSLVTVTDRHGAATTTATTSATVSATAGGTAGATEWGPTTAAAARTALGAAVARAQADDPEVRALLAAQPVGTAVLERCPEQSVREALHRTTAALSARGRTPSAHRCGPDPVAAGPAPFHGTVTL